MPTAYPDLICAERPITSERSQSFPTFLKLVFLSVFLILAYGFIILPVTQAIHSASCSLKSVPMICHFELWNVSQGMYDLAPIHIFSPLFYHFTGLHHFIFIYPAVIQAILSTFLSNHYYY